MAALLTWKEPRSVASKEWQEGQIHIRKFMYFTIKWMLLLGTPCIYLVYRLDPKALPHTIFAILVSCPVFIAIIIGQTWIGNRYGKKFSLNKKGIIIQIYGGGESIRWKYIEGFCFLDSDIEDVRAVELRFANKAKPIRLYFDPNKTDEPAIRAVFDQYAPGKHLDVIT